MKFSLAVCVAMVVASSAGSRLYPNGCFIHNGKCVSGCPDGTHAYTLGYGYKMPEPTCLQQYPVIETKITSDYSACYCNPPTVRDQKSDQCVLPEYCFPQCKPPESVEKPIYEEPTE